MYNRTTTGDEKEKLWLKKAIWLYFFLLIFEGALRKWFLPFLATPLLVARDPIALWLIYKVFLRGYLPNSKLLFAVVIVTFLSIGTAIVFGHGNLFVAIFGARIFLIHFPMIFIIGRIFDKDDVLEMGRVLLWISIPMVILIAAQFYSPQDSFVNRGVGGSLEGAGFSGALGYFRPPGTFSFTNGVHLFFGAASCFILYFWIDTGKVSKILLYGSTISLMAAIPLSISRSLAFHVVVVVIFAMLAVARRPENFVNILMVFLGITLTGFGLANLNIFQTSIGAFVARFTTASAIEGGLTGTIGGRYFGNMAHAITTALDQPFFGYGLGMGTNAGSAILTGSRKFLIAEEEWGRTIGELGAFLGICIILIRLALSLKMVVFAYRQLKIGNALSWIFLGYVLTTLPKGQWAQPTALGFSVLVGGLLIAALTDRHEHERGGLA